MPLWFLSLESRESGLVESLSFLTSRTKHSAEVHSSFWFLHQSWMICELIILQTVLYQLCLLFSRKQTLHIPLRFCLHQEQCLSHDNLLTQECLLIPETHNIGIYQPLLSDGEWAVFNWLCSGVNRLLLKFHISLQRRPLKSLLNTLNCLFHLNNYICWGFLLKEVLKYLVVLQSGILKHVCSAGLTDN